MTADEARDELEHMERQLVTARSGCFSPATQANVTSDCLLRLVRMMKADLEAEAPCPLQK
jgi:hypothetical protein